METAINYEDLRTAETAEKVDEKLMKKFNDALQKAWEQYNDSGARTVDSLEDNGMECAFAKGFLEGCMYEHERHVEESIHHKIDILNRIDYDKKKYMNVR